MADDLLACFVRALPAPPADPGGLASALAAALARAEAAWPGVRVAPGRFAAALAERVGDDPRGGLERLDVAGLYLACACLDGDARAQACFEAHCVEGLGAALTATGLPAAQHAEARQRVRHKLLVAVDGAPARLASYGGRGDLRGFVRVVAVREAIGLLRQGARRGAHEAPLADDDALAEAAADDPELQLIKGASRADFREAFAAAMAGLTDRERTLLRLSALDGLSIDQIGAVFGVHRATAARWLAAVRERVFEATRRELMTRLRLDPREFDSLVRAIQSRFEISVCEILRVRAPDDRDDG
jgi:RNA polymerase sigma-70 factor (ECF subfamily)